VVSISGLAPYGAAGLDWFAGMSPAGTAALRAAVAGRTAKEAFEASNTDEDPGFTPSDLEALAGPWKWFLSVVMPALSGGPAPLIDDDLALVSPWGFDPSSVTVPVLFLHGTEDRVAPVGHARWLAARCPSSTLREIPGAGHISVLESARHAVEFLA
jgi:pimeloyl-ACP methyl ester carboxylesterase